MRAKLTIAGFSIVVILSGCQNSKPKMASTPASPETKHSTGDETANSAGTNGKASECHVHTDEPHPAPAQTVAYLHGIEDTRRLMQLSASEGHSAMAIELLGDLLSRVEQEEGRTVAAQTAFSDACNFERHRQFDAAVGAFELFQTRFTENEAVAEAMLRVGECRIEQAKYVEAETVLRGVIVKYAESHVAAIAWRKLALAQLLAGRYDDSLATLDGMDKRYNGTHFSEYAKMRKGYVLVAANRVADGKAQYAKFLVECSGSEYCRFATRELAKLEAKSKLTIAQ